MSPGGGPSSFRPWPKARVLGWSWLVSPYRGRFDALALETTRAIAFDGRCLRGKCEEDHEFGYELLTRFSTIMVKRLEATRVQLIDIYGKEPVKASR